MNKTHMTYYKMRITHLYFASCFGFVPKASYNIEKYAIKNFATADTLDFIETDQAFRIRSLKKIIFNEKNQNHIRREAIINLEHFTNQVNTSNIDGSWKICYSEKHTLTGFKPLSLLLNILKFQIPSFIFENLASEFGVLQVITNKVVSSPLSIMIQYPNISISFGVKPFSEYMLITINKSLKQNTFKCFEATTNSIFIDEKEVMITSKYNLYVSYTDNNTLIIRDDSGYPLVLHLSD